MKHTLKKIPGAPNQKSSIPNSPQSQISNLQFAIPSSLASVHPPQNEKCSMLDAQCPINPPSPPSENPHSASSRKSSIVNHQSSIHDNNKPQSSPLFHPNPQFLPTLLHLRPYQQRAFFNRTDGIQIWLWARQTGKSFTLAAWAIDRLLTNPGRLVTILSNSKSNGIELNRKCAEIARLAGHAFQQADLSTDRRFETMNLETHITIHGHVGRIKVLAANPRTARGFSGDLILDEFAYHEDAAAIWEAAEPILAANKDYLCRIGSTPNGKHNMFYRLATDPQIPLLKITRTDAHAQGCPVFHPISRAQITPTEARALAQNKRAYDQNYQCAFEDQNMSLLTHELISAAERPNIGIICEQNWTLEALTLLNPNLHQVGPAVLSGPRAYKNLPINQNDPSAPNTSPNPKSSIVNHQSSIHTPNDQCPMLDAHCSMTSSSPFPLFPPVQPSVPPLLYAGVDVARHHDQTVITLLEKLGSTYLLRAILRLRDMRLPDQQERLETILNLPNLRALKIDMTGLGLGLFEYTQQKFPAKISGINFSSSVPLFSPFSPAQIRNPQSEIRNQSVRVTEHLATQLLQTFEDRSLQIPIDPDLRDDLRKPERLVSPSGRVSIAATRDASGHADHFWSLALALDAAQTPRRPPPASEPVYIRHSSFTGGRAPRKHRL